MAVSRYVQTAPLASSSLGKRESCSTADVIALIRQHASQVSEDKVDPKTNEQLKDIQKELAGLGESLQILESKAAKSKQSEPDKLVKNTVSGKTHLVLVEPGIGKQQSDVMTWCGWRFMGTPHELITDTRQGDCGRCFRELRAAKNESASSSGSSGASSSS